MVDPLSVSASIVALLQLTSFVSTYLRDVKDASKDCKKLLVEISFTRGILDTLKDTIVNVDSSSDSWVTTLQTTTDPGGPLEALRTLMLDLEAKLEKAASAKGVEKIAKTLVWPFTSRETVETIRLVERQKMLLTLALQNDHLRLSKEIMGLSMGIEKDVKDVVRAVELLEIGLQDSLTEKALSWLSPLSFQATQKDIFRRRSGNSGSWFLRRPEFQDWLAGRQNALFCPGIPGAGKTVLASLVIDHLLSKFPSGNECVPVAIVWIYCNYKNRQAQTLDHFLGSIVSQLVQQQTGLLNDVVELYKKHSSMKEAPPDPADILELLDRSIRCYHTVFVVIDALDECDNEDKTGRRLFDALKRLQPNVLLLITSRPLPDIVEEFEDVPQIEIRALDTDIRDFVRSRLEVEPRLKKHIQADAKFGELIEDAVAEKSAGMFLMAKLHTDALVKWAKYSKMAVHRALDKLPKELDTTYDQAWHRINDQNADDACLAQQVLSWICLAYEPLNILSLQQALAVQSGDPAFDTECLIEAALIISVCAGLVVLDQESQLVRLVHYTTQDYFQRRLPEYLPDAGIQMSTACLGHLLEIPIPEWDPQGVDRFPLEDDPSYDRRNKLYNKRTLRRFFLERQFTAYTCNHLVTYVQRTPDPSLWGPLKEFWYSRNRQTLNQINRGFGEKEETDAMEAWVELSEVQLAVYFGYQDEVVRMLGSIDLDVDSSSPRPLLCIASSQGHEAIVTTLLDAGATIEANMRSSLYDRSLNALEFAISGAHISTIRLLAKTSPGLLSAPIDQRRRMALHFAAKLKSPLVIETLVSCGAVIDVKDSYGMTPLHLAADAPRGQDRQSVIRALVEGGSTVNAADCSGCTPLNHACRQNNIETAHTLIINGADVDGYGEGYELKLDQHRPYSPLWYAVHCYNVGMVSLLLEKAAIVTTHVGGFGLSFPMPVRHGEEIQQLLRKYDEESRIVVREDHDDYDWNLEVFITKRCRRMISNMSSAQPS